METRKYNAARKACRYGDRTFDAIVKTLGTYTDLDKLTGKQIGELVNAMYASCETGRNEMYKELGWADKA